MSGDTYSIYVKVDSTQAKTAAKDLEKLGEASVTAEVSIKKVGTASTEASTKMDAAAKAAKQQADWFGKLSQAAEPSVLWITKLSSASASASGAINNVEETTKKAAAGMDVFSTAVSLASRATLLFIGIELARAIRDGMNATKEAADAYTNMKSKLDIATYSQQELNKSFEDSFNIANKYYTSVTDVASAYAKFNPIVASLGRNTADTAKIVESLSASLLISGNNTVDAAETFRQFAQAISGPKVQMEEMNTIIDSNQALWRGLQREFPDIIAKYGSLKEAISKQAISNDMLINATIKLGDEFEALAARKVPTIENAMTVLNNSFVQYVGEANDASGASSALASIILDLAESLRSVEGKGQNLAAIINVIAQAMAGTRGAVADYIDLMAGLANAFSGFSMAQNQMDPEIAKLMKLGAGQVPIADLAAKPTAKPTTQPQLTPRGTGGDSKAAAKEAKDALDAFKATIAAQLSAAQNAEKLYDAISNNSKKRYDIELAQVQGLAELKIRSTKSETMRLAITEEAQAKIIDAINQETNLRQAAVDKDMETLAVKMAGVKQEIDAADANKLKQAERIELATKLSDVETEMSVKRAERTQIELDAIGKIQEADQGLAKARQKAAEALVKEESLRQLEVMTSNLEYAKEMATGLADAFGEVGAAIGGMSVAMAEYDKQSATIEIARKEAVDKAEGDQKRITEINDDAAKKQSKAQIKSYGDMTQAAQGFFKKGSKGYEAMGAAVKVFRVFEMAQSAMSMAKQIGDMGSMLTEFIGMETTKTTTKIASNTAQQTSDAAGAVTSATKAVADAGQGDPYTGIIRAAAMLAFMAAIGIAVGGGGGGSTTAVKPPEPGTGTVKGDPLAVSESISKSIGIIEENSSNDLNYSADMLDALYQIRDALKGVENLIASDLTPTISSLMLKFGDGVKQAGFIFRDQQLSKILASGRVEGYVGARIETESSQMMITVKKGQTMVAEYGDKFAKAFGGVVMAIKGSIVEVGKVIGITDTEITERLKGFKVKLGTIDIAGLSAADASKKIEAAFSAMSDTMAMRALPEFKNFQQSGEGYKQTIVRVAEGIQRAKGSLELLGMEAINYQEITNKNKDVAAEITRETIMAQGDLSEGTRKYVKQLTGSAQDIIDSYKQILNITKLLRGGGFATGNLDRTMINAAGGLSAFEEALQSFRDNFMSDTQKVTADTIDLTQAFGKLGFALPKSKEEFYNIALGIDTSTEGGKKLFAQFMLLNASFSDLTDAAQQLADVKFSALENAFKDLQGVQQRFLDNAKSIRAYLDELTGSKSAYASPEERYRKARDEFDRLRRLAAAGDEDALSKLSQAGRNLLDASREYNASNSQFQADFETVTRSLESAANYAQQQADIAESQLRAAENSYQALLRVDQNTLGMQAAINALSLAMADYANTISHLPIGGRGGRRFASGGNMPAGVSLVGEYGPELISSSGGYVSSASATANFFATIKDAITITSAQQTELLKNQVQELQALVRLQSAANRELIAQLAGINAETTESTRIARLEASA